MMFIWHEKIESHYVQDINKLLVKILEHSSLVSHGEWCLMFPIGPGSSVWRVQRQMNLVHL